MLGGYDFQDILASVALILTVVNSPSLWKCSNTFFECSFNKNLEATGYIFSLKKTRGKGIVVGGSLGALQHIHIF